MENMIKNVVFDLGGVVVDWSPERLLATYPGDKELPVALFKKGFFQQYRSEFDRGTITQAEMVIAMSDFAGRTYAECWDFVEFIKHTLDNLPATCELIEELSERGFRLFCLSNMSVEYYDYLKDRKVFSFFEGRIISALEHTIKPEKEIYQILFDRYHLVPEETLFVDDLIANIEAAHALGIQTVHFTDRIAAVEKIRELTK